MYNSMLNFGVEGEEVVDAGGVADGEGEEVAPGPSPHCAPFHHVHPLLALPPGGSVKGRTNWHFPSQLS